MTATAVVSCVLQFFPHFWYCFTNHYSWQQMEEKKKEEAVIAVCWWLLAGGVLKNNKNEIQAAKTEAKCLSLSVGLLPFIEIQMSWEAQEIPPKAKQKIVFLILPSCSLMCEHGTNMSNVTRCMLPVFVLRPRFNAQRPCRHCLLALFDYFTVLEPEEASFYCIFWWKHVREQRPGAVRLTDISWSLLNGSDCPQAKEQRGAN